MGEILLITYNFRLNTLNTLFDISQIIPVPILFSSSVHYCGYAGDSVVNSSVNAYFLILEAGYARSNKGRHK